MAANVIDSAIPSEILADYDVGETLASAAGALLDGSDAGDEFEFDDVDDE